MFVAGPQPVAQSEVPPPFLASHYTTWLTSLTISSCKRKEISNWLELGDQLTVNFPHVGGFRKWPFLLTFRQFSTDMVHVFCIRGHSITTWTMSVFVHAQGVKTVHVGGEGS